MTDPFVSTCSQGACFHNQLLSRDHFYLVLFLQRHLMHKYNIRQWTSAKSYPYGALFWKSIEVCSEHTGAWVRHGSRVEHHVRIFTKNKVYAVTSQSRDAIQTGQDREKWQLCYDNECLMQFELRNSRTPKRILPRDTFQKQSYTTDHHRYPQWFLCTLKLVNGEDWMIWGHISKPWDTLALLAQIHTDSMWEACISSFSLNPTYAYIPQLNESLIRGCQKTDAFLGCPLKRAASGGKSVDGQTFQLSHPISRCVFMLQMTT